MNVEITKEKVVIGTQFKDLPPGRLFTFKDKSVDEVYLVVKYSIYENPDQFVSMDGELHNIGDSVNAHNEKVIDVTDKFILKGSL